MMKLFLKFAFIALLHTAISHPIRDEKLNSIKTLRRFKRGSNGMLDEDYRWADATVPYQIDMTGYTEEHVAQIDKAIQLIQQATCVRFIARTDEEDYVTFTGDSLHCSSMVGREGGEQFIKLTKDDAVGEGCFQIGSVMHEIMHALGFYHMHKSPERDDFITIMWDNIDKGDHSKLDKREDEEDLTNFGLGYDFDSIMHYSSKLYSINDEDTLVAANPEDTLRMGQREWLSDGDILRIRRMYNCWGQEAVERMTEKEEFATRTSQHYSGLSDTTLTVGQETSIATSSTSENIEQKPEPTNSSIEPELSNLV